MPTDYDIGAAIERIENELIDSMMRNLKLHLAEEEKMGFDWMMWQVEQLKNLEEYRKKNAEKYGKQFRNINLRLEHVLEHGRTYGQKEEELRILQALKEHPELKRIFKQSGSTRIQGGNFFKINESKLESLIKATTNDMEKAEYAVLRRCNDQYRKVIFDAQMYANTGAGTVEKAIDMATHDFLMRGIDCIEYANGARHTLSDYADMAIRTAERRAYLMGAGEMRKKWGIATVIVNRRGTMTNGNYGTACPKCIPWLGKVLIDDVWSGGEAYINGKNRQQSAGAKAVPTGKSPITGRNYPLMSAAIAAGLYHPRCKDVHTTYFEGISSEPEPVTKEELKRGAEQERQEARQNYVELQAEKFGRLAKYALDPENRQKYEARAEAWKKIRNVRLRTGSMSSAEYAEGEKTKKALKDIADNFPAVSAKTAREKLLSESKEWAKKMHPKEIRSITKYAFNMGDRKGNEFFRRLNAALAGRGKLTSSLKQHADNISNGIKKFVLRENIICYRGIDLDPTAGIEVGGLYFPQQFLSSSISSHASFKKKYVMVIYARRGATGAYIENFSPYGETQKEFLFDKDCVYRILYRRGNKIGIEVFTDG